MQIAHKTAVLLFMELGFRNADKYTVERLNTKLADLNKHFSNDEPMETDEGRQVLKDVMAALEKGEEVAVTATPAEVPAETPAKGKKKPAAEEPPAETPAKEPAAAPAKPKAATKPAKQGKAEVPEPTPAKGKKKDAGKAAEKIVAESVKQKDAAKAKAKPAPAKEKESKDTIPLDDFGNRTGTDLAKINSCLGAKGKDLAALTEASGVRRGRVRRQVRKLVKKGLVKKDKDGLFSLAK